MIFNTLSLALCLSLLTPALASPAQVAGEVESASLTRRVGANTCDYSRGSGDDLYTILLAGWGNNDFSSKSGCGGGLLDNLRGQCGSNIIDWRCEELHENPHDTKVTFTLQTWMRAKAPGCVTNAIKRASEGRNVQIGCACHPRTGNC